MALELIGGQAEGKTHSTPLLFVHGGWHGAWCWDQYFLPYFASQGYRAYALSLRGHGGSPKVSAKPMAFNTVGDYVADVAEAAARIEAETGQRPAVIGHSMGGYIAQRYLEKHRAPAAVLMASIPADRTIPFQLRLLWQHPFDLLRALLTLNGWPLVSTPAKAHKLFFSADMPHSEVEKYQAQMNGESLWILVDVGFSNRPQPRKIIPTPLLVIAAEKDAVFTLEEERATARVYGAPIEIFPNMAHDMMLERDWEKVAQCIAQWLDAQGI